ncbi:transketolase [Spirosoma utsteinense]|uniref:Transketolase n=1 Tax=Spirosoma utsteinense TaxID=2585773 RepID=A0ABR6W530_9BACT|nr:transketolase [Spirosoma utsteinense]MBC3785557.1 transketolase [Spirosoma utsteinense]MBC3791705.1 transketolase [Spirosoma utsteinense]
MTTKPIDIQSLRGQLRLRLLGLYNQAHAGHIGCSLSCIDLMIATLILRKRPQDTFLLSKGHAAAALYACLNYLGDISDDELATYYKNGTTLPAHPAPNQHKGIPFATGSLGHGLPIGVGIAHAGKLLGDDSRVYVLMSDGETNEGTTWEAAHFALQHKLDNLAVLIDKNGLQGFGRTADVFGDTADVRIWETMGFETIEVDGHDVEAVLAGLDNFQASGTGKPKLVIAHTVKGKGVSYMENRLEWHYLPMTPAQYEQACADVSALFPVSLPA